MRFLNFSIFFIFLIGCGDLSEEDTKNPYKPIPTEEVMTTQDYILDFQDILTIFLSDLPEEDKDIVGLEFQDNLPVLDILPNDKNDDAVLVVYEKDNINLYVNITSKESYDYPISKSGKKKYKFNLTVKSIEDRGSYTVIFTELEK